MPPAVYFCVGQINIQCYWNWFLCFDSLQKTEVMHLERKENVRGLPEAICVFEQCNYCLAVGLLLLYLMDIINWLDQQAAFHFAWSIGLFRSGEFVGLLCKLIQSSIPVGGGERSCVWDVFVGHESMLFHTKSRLHNVARLVFLPKFSVLYGTRGERALCAPHQWRLRGVFAITSVKRMNESALRHEYQFYNVQFNLHKKINLNL